jgi:hypothetical protein
VPIPKENGSRRFTGCSSLNKRIWVNDPRRTKHGNIRHKLADIIMIGFTAALCGYEDYEEMEEFGQLKMDFSKRFLNYRTEYRMSRCSGV